ncbi:Guanylate kinase [Hypsibius exemplaris]|uniref:guanylate kinase n=1 Tax=Hypsibius exemplaris TaxID=2072580 RepID=A0A9X6RL81_HYPEX|nr:Guanylate kinase [Hypsibius exemplaris]
MFKSASSIPHILLRPSPAFPLASRHFCGSMAVIKAPRPVVLSGPSGCGKSTLITRLMEDLGKDKLGFSVSHTTRQPRPGEQNHVHYHFVTREEFEQAVEAGEFVEIATFSGNRYGTSKKAIQDVIHQGKLCLLDIDSQGVKNVKTTDLNPVYLFIRPPSQAVLEQRLRSRGTETEEAIQKRLAAASTEMAYGDTPGNYDYVIINDDLDVAYGQLKSIIQQVIRENSTTDRSS